MKNRTDGKQLTIVPEHDISLAERACVALDAKFGANVNAYGGNPFTFKTQRVIAPLPGNAPEQAGPAIAVMAAGPWDLSGRDRPAHGTMQTFAEGVIAALRPVADAAKDLQGCVSDAKSDGDRVPDPTEASDMARAVQQFADASRKVLAVLGIE